MPIRGIAFEGGGVAGIGHVGALEEMQKNNLLNDVKYLAGSSAGSMVAGLLGCNIPIDVIHDYIFNVDFNEFKDDNWGVIQDVFRLYTEFGWYKGDALEDWYGKILKEHCGNENITLKQIYDEYGKYLILTMVDINCGEVKYMTPESYPYMKLKVAVRRSSSIPIFFKADSEVLPTQVKEGKTEDVRHFFIDGGTLDNYPIHVLYKYLPKDEVVGMKLMSSEELSKIGNPSLPENPYPPVNIFEYLEILITMLRNHALKAHVDEDDWVRTIKIDIHTISATDFHLSEDDKKLLLQQGVLAVQKFFNKI